MLVNLVSHRPPRLAIAADVAEVLAALDSPGTGNVVFATLVDDPASVGDTVDAYLGEIMVEAASATDSLSASVPAVLSADVAETAAADSAQDATAALPYATWSTTDKSANVTLTNGNLTAATTSGLNPGVRGNTGKSSGKYYWEATMTDWSGASAGIGLATAAAPFGALQTGQAVATKAGGGANGAIYIDGSYSGSKISTFAPVNGDIAGIAVDLTAGLIWFRLVPSGNWNNNAAANPATGANGVSLGAMAGSVLFPVYGASSIQTGITANFGASAFVGAVPSGFTSGWTT